MFSGTTRLIWILIVFYFTWSRSSRNEFHLFTGTTYPINRYTWNYQQRIIVDAPYACAVNELSESSPFPYSFDFRIIRIIHDRSSLVKVVLLAFTFLLKSGEETFPLPSVPYLIPLWILMPQTVSNVFYKTTRGRHRICLVITIASDQRSRSVAEQRNINVGGSLHRTSNRLDGSFAMALAGRE